MKSDTRASGRFRWILHVRFTRFLLVGLLNALFGYAVFAGIYSTSRNQHVAIIVATLMGIAFNFFTTGKMVFGNSSFRAALPFALGYGVSLALNLLIVDGLIAAGVNGLLAQALTLPVIVLTSYFINAKVVFRAG